MNLITLNSFQQMMVQWNALAPYNAGHVMHLQGTPDVERWKQSALKIIQELKLGIPQFLQNYKKVSFKAITTLFIEQPLVTLDHHIEAELNRPFLENDFPIRFFIIRSEPSTYYFGAIYNHWISDSYAMRALFQRIYLYYQTDELQLPPLTLHAPDFRSLFHRYIGRCAWWDSLKACFQNLMHFQSAYRLKINHPLNLKAGFIRHELPAGLITKLIQFSKKQKISLNDVFLTALAKAMGEHTQLVRQQQKRKKFRLLARNRLALGTIVDIRHAAENELKSVFGQYLSQYTLVLKEPEQTSFTTLLKSISTQTQKIKKTFQTIKNFATWNLSLFTWNLASSQKSKARFFQKHAPLLAGISNVNLTPSWAGQEGDILDYLRISPSGVLIPLVFTLTTLHQQFSLCVTYRTTVFSREEINRICHSFTTYLNSNTEPTG